MVVLVLPLTKVTVYSSLASPGVVPLSLAPTVNGDDSNTSDLLSTALVARMVSV